MGAAWAGRYAFYSQQLESGAHSDAYVNESDNYAGRRLGDVIADVNYTFGIKTARRLSALSPGGAFVTPTFSIEKLTIALNDFSMLAITLGSIVGDVGAAIIFDVLSSSFSLLMDSLWQVFTTALEVLKMIVKSGMLSVLINIGIDFLLVSITEIFIPSLFAGLDFLICVLDLFNIGSWFEQLSCAERECFKGPNAASDLIIFTSVPVVLNRVAAILEATVNSRTAKAFVTGDQGVTSKGKTRDRDTRETIPNQEPEGSTSPKPDVTFVQDTEDFFSNPEVDECAACFVCKFPEMRLVWYLVTTIASIASSSNFYEFSGDVVDNCMNNGV